MATCALAPIAAFRLDRAGCYPFGLPAVMTSKGLTVAVHLSHVAGVPPQRCTQVVGLLCFSVPTYWSNYP